MNFDLRLPIGILFSLFGLILTIFGFATTDSDIYQKSLGHNINISWGIVMLLFGSMMLFFANRGQPFKETFRLESSTLKPLGGVAALVGVGLVTAAIVRLNSMESQMIRGMGGNDNASIIMLVIGIPAAISGVWFVLASNKNTN